MQTQDHWAHIGRRIATMGPPQVPGPEITEQINAICAGCQGLTVLLGVTPAYAALGSRLLAFDSSPGMISAIWPGNDARRQADVADWVALPVATASAQQVLGDGALNSVPNRTVLPPTAAPSSVSSRVPPNPRQWTTCCRPPAMVALKA